MRSNLESLYLNTTHVSVQYMIIWHKGGGGMDLNTTHVSVQFGKIVVK